MNGYVEFGYVNKVEELIYKCKNKLDDDIFQQYNKIVVIHHNFFPVPNEDTMMKGGADLNRILKENDFMAVLHVHSSSRGCS